MPPTKRKSAAGNAANQGTSSKAKPAGKAKPVTGKAATGKAKPAAKDKPAAAAEATVGKDGYTTWSLPDGVVHYKCSGEPARDSIAAFSLDDTITVVKSGARQQLDADDWAFFGEDVPGVLREAHKSGQRVVIITNQGGLTSVLGDPRVTNAKTRIEKTIAAAGVPIDVVMAPQRDGMRKPNTKMWHLMLEHANGNTAPIMAESYFVGGEDVDKAFAAAVGIPHKGPGEVFTKAERIEMVRTGNNRELRACMDELATWLVSTDDVVDAFEANALRRVSQALKGCKTVQSSKDVEGVKDIGESSVTLIGEYLRNGTIQKLENLKAKAGM